MAPVFGQNKIRTGVRIIRLRRLVGGHVVDCYDDGADEAGRPNQQRQHLINVLKKRVLHKGAELRTFVLAEPPPPWKPSGDPKRDAVLERDRFDSDYLRNSDGDWLMPSPKWLEAAAELTAADRAIADEQAAASKARRAQKGMEGLTLLSQLAAAVAPQAPAAPAPAVKPAPGKVAP